jgi:hypothetical protein
MIISTKAIKWQVIWNGECSSYLSLFGWLVTDGWCWFVLREEYCWLVLAGCWWLVCSERKILLVVADKPSEQGEKNWRELHPKGIT